MTESQYVFPTELFDLSIDSSFCIVTVCLLLFHNRIHEVLNTTVTNALSSWHQVPTLLEKADELRELRKELSALSPTNQFALYFKKERQVDKATADYQKLAANSSLSLKALVGIRYGLHALLRLIFLLFLRTSSLQSQAFRIPSEHFWPLNALLSLPDYSAQEAVVGGVGTTKVSLFVLVFLVVVTVRRFHVWR